MMTMLIEETLTNNLDTDYFNTNKNSNDETLLMIAIKL